MPPKRKAAPVPAPTTASKSPSSAVSTILPNALYLGPVSAASSSAFLTSHSITHVLSIGATPSSKLDSVTYHRLALNDTASSSITCVVDKAVCIIDSALKSNKARGRILVHCSAGVSRSPTVITGYLMKSRGMTLKAALGMVVRARPQVSPNPGFLAQLRELERELRPGEGGSLDVEEMPRREVDRLALFAEGEGEGGDGDGDGGEVELRSG